MTTKSIKNNGFVIIGLSAMLWQTSCTESAPGLVMQSDQGVMTYSGLDSEDVEAGSAYAISARSILQDGLAQDIDAYAFLWSLHSGDAEIFDADTPTPTIIPRSGSQLILSVAITNLQTGVITFDTITLDVLGAPPLAEAESTADAEAVKDFSAVIEALPETMEAGEQVDLSVEVSGGVAPYEYQWNIDGDFQAGVFDDASTDGPVFLAKHITDECVNVRVTVTDQEDSIAQDTQCVSIVDHAPDYFIDITGINGRMQIGDQIELSVLIEGADPDNVLISWSVFPSRAGFFTNSNAETTTFTAIEDASPSSIVVQVVNLETAEWAAASDEIYIGPPTGGLLSASIECPDGVALNGQAQVHVDVQGGESPYEVEWTVTNGEAIVLDPFAEQTQLTVFDGDAVTAQVVITDDTGETLTQTCNVDVQGDACSRKLGLWYVDVDALDGGTGSQSCPLTSIQEAIRLAEEGDVIVVDSGWYYESINFNGKDITVQADTSARLVGDGSISGPVVRFESGETNKAKLIGFTVSFGQGGKNGYGGGILCEGSSPTIEDNVIEGNQATYGGGIALVGASMPIIRNNVIRDNAADYGGGIFANEQSAKLNPKVLINDNTIEYNRAEYDGGGIKLSNYLCDITGNVIRNNDASSGAGIDINDGENVVGELLIDRNYIEYNVAGLGTGGGIKLSSASPIIRSNMINFNQASQGAALAVHNESSPVMTNNTMISNRGNSILNGAAWLIVNDSHVLLSNSIWSNNDGIAIMAGDGGQPSSIRVNYSVYTFAAATTYRDGSSNEIMGVGNLGAGSVELGLVNSAFDLHLRNDSPLIDVGEPNDYTGLLDIDGNPRLFGGRVDVGADEWSSTVEAEITCPDSMFAFNSAQLVVEADGGQGPYIFEWSITEGVGDIISDDESVAYVTPHSGGDLVIRMYARDQIGNEVERFCTVSVE